MAPTVEDFTAAGLYDPDAPDAPARLELLEYLVGRGADLERLRSAESDLIALGIDMVLESGELTAEDLATRMGVAVDKVVYAYRLVGVEVPAVDVPIFEEGEVAFLGILTAAVQTFPEDAAREILRAISLSLGSLAAAASSAFVGSVEDGLASQGNPAHQAMVTAGAGELGLELAAGLRPLFRHHLRQAVMRQRAATQASGSRQTAMLAVGFVDLVGYTPSSAGMDPATLLDFIGDFRARTHDLIADLGGQVVKHIGDEIMFSSLDPAVCCRIALRLIDAFADAHTAPRGGVAFGRVISRHGDLYGPVVNLASRLVDIAVPGELLVPAELAQELDGATGAEELVLEPAGRRQLKGFTEPIGVLSARGGSPITRAG